MSKHTPGPWDWDRQLQDVQFDGGSDLEPTGTLEVYVDAGDTIIADVNGLIPEGKANANLIKAAPDLLAALESVVAQRNAREALYKGMNVVEMKPDPAWDKARAALKKARGET